MSVSREASLPGFRNVSGTLDLTSAYISANVFNVIVGSSLHCFVLWLIYKGKGGGIVPELFNLNLAVCELLWCLSSSGFVAALRFPALTRPAYFAFAMPTVGRPLFHCLICLDRYLAVLHPVSFLRFRPLRYRLACAAAVWAALPPFGVFMALVLPSDKMSVYLMVFVPLNFLLFSFKLFCLSAILGALKFPKVDRMVNVSRNKEARLKLRKAMTQILIVTVSMLSQYVPMLLLGILFNRVSGDLFQILWCALYMNSSLMAFVNPVLLICRVKKLPWMPKFL